MIDYGDSDRAFGKVKSCYFKNYVITLPGVTLRTTVMTGFPGETAAAFARMLADVKRMQFDHLGVFSYSPEEGTAGAAMKGRPPMKVAQSRALKIIAEQKRIWDRKTKSMVGLELPALKVQGYDFIGELV